MLKASIEKKQNIKYIDNLNNLDNLHNLGKLSPLNNEIDLFILQVFIQM